MEDAYLIKGGKKLKGKVQLSGAKNVALKTIIAALLFDQEVVLDNIPKISDVFELLHLISDLGGKAEFIEKHKVAIDGRSIKKNRLDFLHASKIRASFMFVVPLLYKFKSAYIPNPGGCRIGLRPIDRVIKGMKSLGVHVEYHPFTGYYYAKMDNKPSGGFTFLKPSHTSTECLIMLSVFTDDTVVIENAALEPEIDYLIQFLNESGACIDRKESKIIIKGVNRLWQKKPYTICSDRNEAITYAVLSLATQGEVVLSPLGEKEINTFLGKVKEAGAGIERVTDNAVRIFYQCRLKAVDVTTSPHPGFMTDWQPPWAVLMTQAEGKSVIHERVFENRFGYVQELEKLGAKIDAIRINIKDPKDYYFFNYDRKKEYSQSIIVNGPQKLHNGVLTIKDLRAGATLAIAALIAQGESVVNNASILERGYEEFVNKVRGLGGDIKKI